MKVVHNESAWRAGDVARLVRKALVVAKVKPEHRKRVRLHIMGPWRRPHEYHGRASLDSPSRAAARAPLNMRLWLPNAETLNARALASVAVHEAWHNRGVDHKDMPGHILWCMQKRVETDGSETDLYAWAAKMQLRPKAVRARAPKPKPDARQKAEAALLRAAAMAKKWNARAERARKLALKWERQHNRLERRLQAASPERRER